MFSVVVFSLNQLAIWSVVSVHDHVVRGVGELLRLIDEVYEIVNFLLRVSGDGRGYKSRLVHRRGRRSRDLYLVFLFLNVVVARWLDDFSSLPPMVRIFYVVILRVVKCNVIGFLCLEFLHTLNYGRDYLE